MKAWVQTTPDHENEVTDVLLCIKTDDKVRYAWINGFDDDEWEEAVKFAEDLAKTLSIEYVGEVGEAGHEGGYDED
jgi:hypothetical protein